MRLDKHFWAAFWDQAKLPVFVLILGLSLFAGLKYIGPGMLFVYLVVGLLLPAALEADIAASERRAKEQIDEYDEGSEP